MSRRARTRRDKRQPIAPSSPAAKQSGGMNG